MIKTSVAARRLTLLTLLAVCLLPLFLTGQPAELLRKPENFERSRDYDALHYKLVLEFHDKEKSWTWRTLRSSFPAGPSQAADTSNTG